MYRKFATLALVILCLAGIAAAKFVSPRAAENLPLVVDNAGDEPDATPGDGLCVSTPSSQCTLRAAVDEANALAGADSITFAITGSIGLKNNLIISDSLAIAGPGSDQLTWYSDSVNSNSVRFTGGSSSLSGVALFSTGIGVAHASLDLVGASVTGMDVVAALQLGFGSSATVIDSTFSGNHSPAGGAIYNLEGNLVVINSTISNNISQFGGGGIDNFYGTATIMNSTVISNFTGGGYGGGLGGGILNIGQMSLVNSTVSNNSARFNSNSDGGGIASYGTLTVTSSTQAGNSSDLGHGGGLHVFSGTVTLRNSIIADSLAGGDCSQAGGAIIDGGHNLIEDNSCGFSGGADPLLGPIQDNGGPTFTQALLAGSPAIDAGNPAGCANSFGSLLGFDQRGFFRAFDGDGNGSAICDIGAFEYHSTPPSIWIELPLITR